MLLSTFRVAQYTFSENNIYPVKCSWQFVDPATKAVIQDFKSDGKTLKVQKGTLFSTKTSFPQLKSINFPKDAQIECKVYYDPQPLGASDPMLAHYVIARKAPKHEEFKTKIKILENELNRKEKTIEDLFSHNQLIQQSHSKSQSSNSNQSLLPLAQTAQKYQ